MDRLSFCPSLAQILSNVTPDDVIRCLQLNKMINSAVTNNWKDMKKPEVDIAFKQNKEGARIDATIKRSGSEKLSTLRIYPSGIKPDVECAPLLINRFGGFTAISNYSDAIRQLLEFVLPRIKLTSLRVNAHFTNAEEDAVFETVRDFCDDVRVSIVSSAFNRLQNRLLELGQADRTCVIDQGNVFTALYSCCRNVEYPIVIHSDGVWHFEHVQMIIENWKKGSMKSKSLRIDSSCGDLSPSLARRNIVRTAFDLSLEVTHWGENDEDSQFSVQRQNIDEKILRVRCEGTNLKFEELDGE